MSDALLSLSESTPNHSELKIPIFFLTTILVLPSPNHIFHFHVQTNPPSEFLLLSVKFQLKFEMDNKYENQEPLL